MLSELHLTTILLRKQEIPGIALCFQHSPPPLLEPLIKLLPDEASYIDVCECSHQVLTVKSIHDPTMARDCVGKILQEK